MCIRDRNYRTDAAKIYKHMNMLNNKFPKSSQRPVSYTHLISCCLSILMMSVVSCLQSLPYLTLHAQKFGGLSTKMSSSSFFIIRPVTLYSAKVFHMPFHCFPYCVTYCALLHENVMTNSYLNYMWHILTLHCCCITYIFRLFLTQ